MYTFVRSSYRFSVKTCANKGKSPGSPKKEIHSSLYLGAIDNASQKKKASNSSLVLNPDTAQDTASKDNRVKEPPSLAQEAFDLVRIGTVNEVRKQFEGIRENNFDIGNVIIHTLAFVGGILRKRSSKEVIQEYHNPDMKNKRDLVSGIAATASTAVTTAALASHSKVQEAVSVSLFSKVVSVLFYPIQLINKIFTPAGEKITKELISFSASNGLFTVSIAKGISLFFIFVIQALILGVLVYYFVNIIAFFTERSNNVIQAKTLPVPNESVIDVKLASERKRRN